MMRLRLPRKLKVGARTLAVKSCPRVNRQNDADGEFNPESGTIKVRSGLSPERRLQVLVEEVIHSVEDDRSLAIPHRDVEQLALGLAAVIVDNGLVSA